MARARRGLGGIGAAWASLSLDAKVVGAIGLVNWLLLFDRHTIVQATRDAPLWHLFPGAGGPAWMLLVGLLIAAYVLRDHRQGAAFTPRARAVHLAAIVLALVLLPAVAAVVLRETGRPWTYVHDGAIMVEEAARKLLAGQSPYVADYLDTPLFYWPMINNPALYHLTYFPLLFLAATPFVLAFDAAGLFFDARYLYVPAYLAALAALPLLLPRRAPPAHGLALVALVALSPELFPFVAEGRNDFFVLAFLFAGIALLQRDRRTLGVLALSAAASAKLHAGVLLPFVAAYLILRDGATTPRAAAGTLARAGWAGALLMAVVFVPFVAMDPHAFWDDIVAYNAGGAAWSYPISGMGFSAILLSLDVIDHPQGAFPFWALQLGAAVPLAAWSLVALRRDPTIATLLLGYALTLLAFLFFGRYFHGNYLGYIAAVASPALFLRPSAEAWRVRLPRPAPAAPTPSPVPADTSGK